MASLKSKVIEIVENTAKSIPFVRKRIEQEYDKMLAEIEKSVKPYKENTETHAVLPKEGLSQEDLLSIMKNLQTKEQDKWTDGYVSGAVYHGDSKHIQFLDEVMALHSQVNPLHSDIWPSANKYEAEIVAMTANMMHGNVVEKPDEACGTLSSGGTESILLAMKTYRDKARAERGITKPEMVVPTTAHVAFDKAAQYFGIKMRHIPVDKSFRADLKALKKAINKNTVVVVGSAPSFPHGIIDPIEEMSEIARKHKIGFHTDSCLGGFVIPWAEKLGYNVPKIDFRLPGVTSISVDTHKYGYAAKGTSVVLYRNPKLRHYQYYTATDWSGGLYFSPSFAGSRPGALSAACWATLLSVGEQGYLDATKKIIEAAQIIKKGIAEIPELHILGDPLWVISFASETLNIYQILDAMGEKGWSLNGLHRPSAVHIALTLRHTQAGVAERFVSDLSEAVEKVKANPKVEGGMAPVYGLAATLPFKGAISDILKRYIDVLYKL